MTPTSNFHQQSMTASPVKLSEVWQSRKDTGHLNHNHIRTYACNHFVAICDKNKFKLEQHIQI